MFEELKEIEELVETALAGGIPPHVVMSIPKISTKFNPIKREVMRQVQVYCHNTRQDCNGCFVNRVLKMGLVPERCNAYKSLGDFLSPIERDRNKYTYPKQGAFNLDNSMLTFFGDGFL